MQVTQKTGYKVSAQNPEQAVRSLAEAIIHSTCDPELQVRMGQEGQRRVNEVFDWEAKGRFLDQFHERIFKAAIRR